MADETVPRTAFVDLDRREQRRLLMRSALRIGAGIILLFVLYAVVPDASRSDTRAIVELSVGLLVFAGLLVWQIRRIVSATYPGLRAVETLALALGVLIVVFAFTYLSLSHANAASFSQPLDHVSSVYFTVVTLSTVGFGDITPRTDATQVLVTIQIVFDLVLIAGIARTVVFAAKIGVRRRESERERR